MEEKKQEWERMSSQAMEALIRWREAHPAATFAEIEQELDERLADVRARMLGELAEATPLAEASVTSCAECGRPMQAAGSHPRTLTTRQQRGVRLEREWARCPACGAGFFPPRPGAGTR
jgi:hypothetical protein